MTPNPARFLYIGLALSIGASAPVAAQQAPWDKGDPMSILRAAVSASPSEIATPPAVPAAPSAPAGAGLIIDATEIGVGKFHRYDNAVHPYPAGAWVDHISPPGDLSQTPIVFDNADGAVSIEFSSLEEMLRAVVAAAQRKGKRVSVLNIHAHGLPGAMWYPKDEATKNSPECEGWVSAAKAPDEVNYKQYYSPLSKEIVMSIRRASERGGSYQCTAGVGEWMEVARRVPGLKSYFADDAQIHFQSCVVGLGPVGDKFTKTVAMLLLSGKDANVTTSLAYGLGDWSMPEGMGFWDYVDDAQLERFNRLYVQDHQDREIREKGAIRVAFQDNGLWLTRVISGLDFMTAGAEKPEAGWSARGESFAQADDEAPAEQWTSPRVATAPAHVRIPGTTFVLARR